MTQIQKHLFEMQDLSYREFHAKLMPNININAITGVRIPALRKYAKEISSTNEATDFMKNLPHRYYEENNLHAFLIENIKDYPSCISALDSFLPYINNWATCDSLRPKIFKKYHLALMPKIEECIKSKDTYTVRFGVGMLLSYYLDEHFSPEHLKLVADF